MAALRLRGQGLRLLLLASGCARPPSGSPEDASRSIPTASTVAPSASTVTPTASGVAPTASTVTPTASTVAPIPSTPAAEASTLAPDASTLDTSFLPPAPPVDLPASIRAAVAGAAAALAVDTVTHVEVDAFVLVDADHGSHFRAAVDLARRAVAAYFNGRFDRRPDRAVTVFVFSSQDAYQRFCAGRSHGPCPTTFGQYDRVSREIVMHATPGAETLTHEMVHPIVQQDFPRAPAWLDEGIASLYENPVFSCGRAFITGITNWRYPDVKRALDAPDEPAPTRLDALFGMDTAAFLTLDPAHPGAGPTDVAKENRHYALARYFAQWMDRRHLLWPFYRAFRDGVASDPTGAKAFAAVAGRTPGQADADWEAYVRGLAPPARENPCPP